MSKKEIWLENRPNRNVASIDALKEQGIEVGDDEFVEKLENELDIELTLNKLPKQQKRALRLKLEGYNPKEIAEQMGISVENAWQLQSRAIKKCQELK